MAKTIASLNTLSGQLSSSDYFIVHTDSGDFKVPYSKIDKEINPNCIFRGNSLGTITSSNIDTFITNHGISDGTFIDIFPGDYFTISYPVPQTDGSTVATNRTIRVLGLDVFYNTGDTALTQHHMVCAPDTTLLNSMGMNSTNTTGVSENPDNGSTYGAYVGSDMNQITIPEINDALYNIFGSHLIEHREYLGTTMNPDLVSGGYSGWNGATSARDWFDCKAVLMSEVDVYGCTIWSSSGFDEGIARQMPMYSLNPRYINNGRYGFWLRNVASETRFCHCNGNGGAASNTAAYSTYVRPRFLIG